tara:strand:+ start:953 stop:1771 length:819 start_codon:yes stop_codon:yes gene_type:complete
MKPDQVELVPVIPNLNQSGGLTFSTNGILYFANYMQAGTIGMYQVNQSQLPETFIDLTQWMTSYGDRTPRANGMRIDGQGRLVVAEVGTGKVIRISPGAEKLEVLADSFDGFSLGSVCDVVLGSDGDIYASSPSSGAIFVIRPDDGFVGMLNEELVRVRGLAMSPDGRRLVAAEPDSGRVLVFDLRDDDMPAEMWTLVDFASSGEEPAGLAFDEAGHLFVGLGDAEKIQVFDLVKGALLLTYDAGGPADSLSYGDGVLYVSGGNEIRSLNLQ